MVRQAWSIQKTLVEKTVSTFWCTFSTGARSHLGPPTLEMWQDQAERQPLCPQPTLVAFWDHPRESTPQQFYQENKKALFHLHAHFGCSKPEEICSSQAKVTPAPSCFCLRAGLHPGVSPSLVLQAKVVFARQGPNFCHSRGNTCPHLPTKLLV